MHLAISQEDTFPSQKTGKWWKSARTPRQAHPALPPQQPVRPPHLPTARYRTEKCRDCASFAKKK